MPPAPPSSTPDPYLRPMTRPASHASRIPAPHPPRRTAVSVRSFKLRSSSYPLLRFKSKLELQKNNITPLVERPRNDAPTMPLPDSTPSFERCISQPPEQSPNNPPPRFKPLFQQSKNVPRAAASGSVPQTPLPARIANRECLRIRRIRRYTPHPPAPSTPHHSPRR